MDVKELTSLKLKQSIANYVIPLICIILSLGMLGFYIYPSITGIPLLEQELQNKENLAVQLENKVTKLTNLVDFRQNVDDSRQLIDKALVSEPEVPQLLSQVDLIARESGLAVQRLSYAVNDSGSEAAAAGYQVVAVNLGTEGTYNQVVTFLRNIENASRVINVNNVRFSTESDTGLVSTTFVLISPYVKVESAANVDEPITFDVSDPKFQTHIDNLRNLRNYNITIEDFIDIESLPSEPEAPVDADGDGILDNPIEVPAEPTPEEVPDETPEVAETPTPAENPAEQPPEIPAL